MSLREELSFWWNTGVWSHGGGMNDTGDARTKPNGTPNAFTEAREAFLSQRGLVFTLEWRRFPWTYGADVDCALVGPAYLGNVALGLQGNHWGYQSRDGRTWRYVRRDQLSLLVAQVVEEFAGFVPPLPRRGERSG